MPGPANVVTWMPSSVLCSAIIRDTHRDDDAKGKVDDSGEHNRLHPIAQITCRNDSRAVMSILKKITTRKTAAQAR